MTHPKKPSEIKRYKLMITTFSNIAQRHSNSQIFESEEGDLVKYEDHVKALDQARREGWEAGKKQALKLIEKQENEVGNFLYFWNTMNKNLKYPEA